MALENWIKELIFVLNKQIYKLDHHRYGPMLSVRESVILINSRLSTQGKNRLILRIHLVRSNLYGLTHCHYGLISP